MSQETVERVIMNKETGAIALGIRVSFFDKYYANNIGALDGYQISLSSNEPDGWLIFSGDNDAAGPWMFINQKFIGSKIEDLGAL